MNRRDALVALGSLATFLQNPTGSSAAQDAGDITSWSIAALRRAVLARRVSPTEIALAYLARIERENPRINAVTTISRDRALAEARALTSGRPQDSLRRPLAGVPVLHKDLLITRGVRTTGGSRLYPDWVPVTDADVVTQLATAGAIMLGKTNTPEFGANEVTINDLFGETLNPHDTGRISGGSSGGSAAAITARLALVATGTDTGGSSRAPAALCGCVGFKPTFGLLPTTGVLPFSPVFDHVGLMTRSVADLAAVLAAVPSAVSTDTAGRFTQWPAEWVRGLRIGVPRQHFFDGAEPGVVAAVERTLAALARQGAIVTDVDLVVSEDDENLMALIGPDVLAKYADEYRREPGVFSENIRFWLDAATTRLPPAIVEQLRRDRVTFERRVDALFDTVDVLAMPTVPIVAPPRGEPTLWRVTRNTWPFNVARVPALSVPCGTGAHGLPVGLQIVGRAHHDARVLAVGAAVER